MSDSEDDFASADEGEVETDKPKPQGENTVEKKEKASVVAKSENSKDELPKGGKKEKATEEQTGTKTKNTKQSVQSAEKNPTSGLKGNSKQSGNQKKGKNKGGSKASHKSTGKQIPEKSDTIVKADDIEKPSDIAAVSEVEDKSEDDTVGQSDESKDNKNDKSISETSKLNEIVTGTKTDSDQASDNTSSKSDLNEPISTPVKTHDIDAEKEKIESSDMIQSPSTQSIPRPEPDHTQEQENVLTKLAEAAQENKQSSWGWGWGSSLLNVASNSVTTFTSQVGEGFNTMIETVESTLNVPSPEDLVKKSQSDTDQGEEEDQSESVETGDAENGASSREPFNTDNSAEDIKEPAPEKSDRQSEQDSSSSWFSSWGVGNITKMVESTGKTLVTGSLDVLESLGKKTFDAINEHDPGLKKTRGLLRDKGDKPNLSAVLRDARDHHETRVKQERESEEARKAHFGTLFDDFQGLAHLEALEMLSNQSEKKVNSLITALPPDTMAALKPELLEIKGHFEINDDEDEDAEDHDFRELVSEIYIQLNVGTSPDKLTRVQEKIRQSLKDFEDKNSTEEKALSKEVHQAAIQSLAEFTSKCMEQFHKAGEMVLLHKTQNSDFISNSKQLHNLTKVLCTEVGILSTKFTECLNGCSEADSTASLNQLVTSVYLEASNSSSYIQDGFQLLLPVLQQASIEKNQEP